MTVQELAGPLVFGVTYILITARRLDVLGIDRPAIALTGAVTVVALGILTPAAALEAIDAPTILLLFAVMGMGGFLAMDGFFSIVDEPILRFARTPARLLACIVWGSGLLSALVTNDAVCILAAPLVLRWVKKLSLPRFPFLMGLASAANTGSVATLVGNPQNMLCGTLGGLSYRSYLATMAPVFFMTLAINHALLWWMNRHALRGAFERPNPSEPSESMPTSAPHGTRSFITLGVIALTSLIYALGSNLAWTAATGLVVLMLIHRRDTRPLWSRIDWPLLIFFASLFVVVKALTVSGLPAAFFASHPLWAETSTTVSTSTAWARLAGLFVVGSNVVSNVPFILVVREQMNSFPDPKLAWTMLAMASTFAGNLTLLGSVANIIVSEAAKDVGGLGFWEHVRVGVPLTLLTTAMGTAWIVWTS